MACHILDMEGMGAIFDQKGKKVKKGEFLLKKHKSRGFLVVFEGKGYNYRTQYRCRICHVWVSLPPSFPVHFCCCCFTMCYQFFAEIKYG